MKLVIEDEAGTRSVVPFTSDEITVGRAAEGVTFRLTDRDVSRRHARFLRASGAVFVEDLGSLTGTRVNGEKISSRRRLREGDLVEIGDYDLVLLPEQVAFQGAPPPLPPGRLTPDPTTVGRELPRRVEPGPAPRGVLGRAMVAGAIALALGVLVGFAVGALTAPAPAPTSAGQPAR
jgi:predicted component of type VI protein secretion system